MPRTRGMIGPGARAMGGLGRKPAMPRTTFGGGTAGTLAGATPTRIRPGAAGIGGAMGGMGVGTPRVGPRAAPGAIGPSAGAGVGAFRKGGHAEKKEEVKKHARGGAVENIVGHVKKEGHKTRKEETEGHGDEPQDRRLFSKMFKEKERELVKKHEKGGEVTQFRRGGPVLDRYITRRADKGHKAEEGMHVAGPHHRKAKLHGFGPEGSSTHEARDTKPRAVRHGKGH